MTTNAETVAAELRRLAEAEEACHRCQGLGEFQMYNRPEPGFTRRCSVCSGSGCVPVFRNAEGNALFRKECVGEGGVACPVSGAPLGNPMPNIRGELERCICHGLGWRKREVGEIHGETLLLFAANNRHQSLAGGQVFRLIMDAWEKAALTASTEGAFIEAAILALDAAWAARA